MTGLRTGSLYRRVISTALLVLIAVLVVLIFVVSAVFRAQTERDVNALLAGRIQLAQQLAKSNVPPANLVRRMDAKGLRISLRLTNGQTFGGQEFPPDPQLREVHATLGGTGQVAGARLVISADDSLVTDEENTLVRVLVFTGIGAVLVTAIALLLGVRFALSPLAALTTLAQSIVSGRRGQRLAPTKTNTELGRTAAAFDAALDALEGAEQSARQSEERLRRFVADAAHELRTPITGVQVAAEAVLQLGPETGQAQRERLHMLLLRESQRAGRLVADLLDVARIDAGVELRTEQVSLLALAEAERDRAQLLGPELTVEVTGTDVTVPGDRARLTQVLANLVDNAVAAMAGSGTLSIEVASTSRTGEILVADTGPGVPAGEAERIFDRLTRLDDARDRGSGGSGLGLTIARGFARAHHGDVEYQDRTDGQSGAVFRLWLPRAESARATTRIPVSQGDQAASNPDTRPL